MKRALSILALCTLTACGGGSDAPTEHPQPVCIAPAAPTKVQVFGDSTQYAQLNALDTYLKAYLGNDAVVVRNLAVSGTSTKHPLPEPIDPAAVSLANFGINDSARDVKDVEQYKANLRAMAPSVFETPNPPHDTYAPAMREVAAELGRPVIDVSAYVRSLPGWEKRVPDGVHPDRGLYNEITEKAVGPAMAEIISKLRCGGGR